ncbi:alkane oxidation protein activator PraA [Williamsia sp. CHRR-6]|uniref:alkane oxidation protein activator PraA n=1 Tax=Williamsia sp. CHRR-6 TaxID=2835871 RepID=UPI001BDA38D2|nr:alkane oxidation protein activator PraA [Williamsia sp. CHRR-6]MBT0566717.1 protein activator [Williamsia sp. CHRR-6]
MKVSSPIRTRRIGAVVAAAAAVAGIAVGAGPAGAATISPAGVPFTAPGTITVTSPASFGAPVDCSITLSGTVAADGASASITSATTSGASALCNLPQVTGLPWTLTPTSTTSGTVSNVGFTISGQSCGPATLTGSFDNLTNTLSSTNQSLPGNCTINSLSVVPNPAFTLS